MANPSKRKGTQFETDVVRYLVDHGFPFAERRAQWTDFVPATTAPETSI
jgi:hypothetical protein